MSWNAGRRGCVGALVSLRLAPRQDLSRLLASWLVPGGAADRDVLVLELPLDAGEPCLLSMRPRVRGGNSPAEQGLVDEDACEQLHQSARTLKGFYRMPEGNLRSLRLAHDAEAACEYATGVAVNAVQLLAEDESLLGLGAFGGVLQRLALASAALQAGGARVRRAAAGAVVPLLPPQLYVHLTDLPALSEGFRTAHLIAVPSTAGNRPTLLVRLPLPRGALDTLPELLPPAIAAVLELADRASRPDALPADATRAIAHNRGELHAAGVRLSNKEKGGGKKEAVADAKVAALTEREEREKEERKRMRHMKKERQAMMRSPQGLAQLAKERNGGAGMD